ncbi:hypothetical protein NQ317_014040 [Molorchus minor]|uniref:B30.2/SPRY domain-containing protein n=1 Tax=Molorchus minor TaxID=1323400 RepID=A0ABQ9JYB1_9CUCU|nr:hypothetical protein NQ317_014040 [Molorchus minor]
MTFSFSVIASLVIQADSGGNPVELPDLLSLQVRCCTFDTIVLLLPPEYYCMVHAQSPNYSSILESGPDYGCVHPLHDPGTKAPVSAAKRWLSNFLTYSYIPYPGGGEKWGGNGVGDDLYSYGFDGAYLWSGGRSTRVVRDNQEPYIRKFSADVVGCALDLTVPIINFTFNGLPVRGCFRNFNLDGMFFPVVSCSSKLSCRFLLGGDHGKLKYAPLEDFSPLVESLLPQQVLLLEPCFYFGNMSKHVIAGPLYVEDDTAFVPNPVDTAMVSLASYVESIRDKLAENIHEMWAMNKIEAGWQWGEYRDDIRKIHPCLVPFDKLPPAEKRYDSQLAVQTLKTIIALGYYITMDKPPSRIKTIRLPNEPFMQANGYKPAPLDLSAITLTAKLEELVDQLAENTHNLWAKERIQQGWTYGLNEDPDIFRSPHLVPYSKVDDAIKKANRDTASETVRTLLVYGYNLDPPTGEQQETLLAEANRLKHSSFRTYRAEKNYAVSSGKWYFEFEILTTGPMRVGWAKADCAPGCMLGSDENTWAFDGYNQRKHHTGSFEPFGIKYQIGDVVGCFIDIGDGTIITLKLLPISFHPLTTHIQNVSIDIGALLAGIFSSIVSISILLRCLCKVSKVQAENDRINNH